MGIKVVAHTVISGRTQQLEQAQGEDVEFRLTFTDAAGVARDFTGAQSIRLTVRDRIGQLIFAREYSGFQGGASAGTPRFQVLQADTVDEAVQAYDLDVKWTDASGYVEQLLTLSQYLILLGVGQTGDPLTMPPPIPVAFGAIVAFYSNPTMLPSPSMLSVPSGYARIARLDNQLIHTDGWTAWYTAAGDDV